jgi:putative transposase
MRKSRFTEEQIIGIVREHEAGSKTAELCRRHGISEQTLYRCFHRYSGVEVSEARRLKALEDENARLKRLVADQALDNQMLRELLRNNSRRPPAGGRRCARSRRCLACRSGAPARWSGWGVPPCVCDSGPVGMPNCGFGCRNWPDSGGSSAIAACMRCSGRKGIA